MKKKNDIKKTRFQWFFLFVLVLHQFLGTGTNTLANRMGLQPRAATTNLLVRFVFDRSKNGEIFLFFFRRLESTDETNESKSNTVETSINIDRRSSANGSNVDRSPVNFLFETKNRKMFEGFFCS